MIAAPDSAEPTVVRTLVRCDGAFPPAALGQQAWTSTERIDTAGPHANLTFRLDSLVGPVLSGLSPRSADMLRIAAFAYRADQLVSRGGESDADGDRWRRHFALVVPVTEPAYWGTAEVKELLASALRFGTDDGWEFAFVGLTERSRPIQLRMERLPQHEPPTCVVMFSGGADSLCALLEAAAQGERPVPVGHWSAPVHQHRQLDLLTAVRARFPGWTFPPVGFVAHGSGAKEAAERTQRTRGFLYACLGAVVAAEAGVGRVLFGDNGPVSLNLPLNGQEVGAVASRSTHPRFLARVNALIADVLGGTVSIENPLADRTRAEGLQVLRRTRCEDLLRDTLSCSAWHGLPEATPHCGGCSQCVDRRFATVAASLEDYDPAGRYRSDVFLDELTYWRDQQTAESYVRTARKLVELGDLDLLAEYGQLYDAVLDDDPDPDGTVLDLVGLTKRHARMVLDGLRRQTEEHLDALVEGRLPDRCLLRTTMGGVVAERLVGAGAGPKGRGGILLDRGRGDDRPIGVSDAVDHGNRVECDGKQCEVVYRGRSRSFGQSVGLLGLAVLLRESDRTFTAEEIRTSIQGREPHPLDVWPVADKTEDIEGDADGMDPDEPDPDLEGPDRHELHPESFAGGGRVFDRESKAFIEEALAVDRAELARAEAAGDAGRVAALTAKIAETERERGKGLGIGRRPRPFSEDQGRADDAMHRAIVRAIGEARRRFPEFGEHVRTSYVHTNRRFAYQPTEPTPWGVKIPARTKLRRPHR